MARPARSISSVRATICRRRSPDNSYWLWGPGDRDYDTVIVIGSTRVSLEKFFAEVIPAAKFECAYCMGYENDRDIFICRKPRAPMDKVWPMIKMFV